ncbi:MAG: ATPase synthesis protein 25 mitochondrial [Peltula sp. TS41687]|nr:MAG: ATPase synthesis protein 25 mitochondrial [Peltula sp. TS41687]
MSTDGSVESSKARQDVEVEPVDNDIAESDTGEDGYKKKDTGLDTIQSEPLPWYLTPSENQPEIWHPLSDRQRLPDLPDCPPPSLQPLLQHLSLELGLDDLILLDLRGLDPPPALGENTLMVVGTARSEKHLHVSADCLCRWLRGQFKLRPYADGLLGRNELKLKMRRRTRRAKLLGSLTGVPADDVDDELRAGWVCVNIGKVEPCEPENSEPEVTEGIVGFGAQTEGVRIVVQMFTEEKRSEMDLEGLWGGLLKESNERQSREQYKRGQVELDRFMLSNEHEPMGKNFYSNRPNVSRKHSLNSQTRRLHTSAQLSNAGVGTAIAHNHDITEQLLQRSGHLDERGRSQSPISDVSEPNLSAERRTAMLLHSLVEDLQNMPREEAVKALGQGGADTRPTPFLLSFYRTFPTFPTAEHWHCRVQLYCHAMKLLHPCYSYSDLKDLLSSMQLSGIDIPEETLYLMLKSICSQTNAQSSFNLTKAKLKIAMLVLEDMANRDVNVLTEEIFILLHEAIAFDVPVLSSDLSDATKLNPSLPNPELVSHDWLQNVKVTQARLKILMDHYMVSFARHEHIVRLLTFYANQGDWAAFFEAWALPARQMLPRSPALYAFMFDIVAQTNHQMFCMQTLRTYTPELQSEDPTVRIAGAVARSVMKCLKCAHPTVEEEAQQVPLLRGEWVTLWRRCVTGLQHTLDQGLRE